MLRPRPVLVPLLTAAALFCTRPLPAAEKTVILDDFPRELHHLEVSPDGARIFAAAGEYLVLAPDARVLQRIGTPQGSSPCDLIPLPEGGFLACNSYGGGHLALWRADGTEARVLVRKGSKPELLRADMTGWTSPRGAAVDAGRRRVFVLDTTMAPRDDRKIPDPDWSRIAIYDLDGQYLGDIHRYDAHAADAAAQDERRTWYGDIEVDAARSRLYVTAARTRELLAFGYDGALQGRAPGREGIAVLPDGRIAVGDPAAGHRVLLYDAALKPLRALEAPRELGHVGNDLESDDAGRLYATCSSPGTAFARWDTDLQTLTTAGPRFARIEAAFVPCVVEAGTELRIPVLATGRPVPAVPGPWQAWLRPADGSDLRWTALPVRFEDGRLHVQLPAAPTSGLLELGVRFGTGPVDRAGRDTDLFVTTTLAVRPPAADSSLAVVSATGRRVFRLGEPVDVQLVRRAAAADAAPVDVQLRLARGGDTGPVLATYRLDASLALRLAGEFTAHLVPGDYRLEASPAQALPACALYPLTLAFVAGQPDSPLQRIAYQEFDNDPATLRQPQAGAAVEAQAFIRDHLRAFARQGFTRETDRMGAKIDRATGPAGFTRLAAPVPLVNPACPPAEYLAAPAWNQNWEAEFYLDEATRHGVTLDTQILGHCDGVRFRDYWLDQYVPHLQRLAQWLGRYPAFRGFNYNDELFFAGWGQGWTQDDSAWLKTLKEERFAGRPDADHLMHALRTMYGAFNAAVRQALPAARITTTPMWQFPAVDGSYPPVVYAGMDETYSHFLSEGYHYPWYPAHSVEFLRRPYLPLMGVFDNSYGYRGGDGYLQDLMQVLGRGVQGAGTQHKQPFQDPEGADAYRVGNALAAAYGPLFAEAPPLAEGAILYSYSQDVTEKRNSIGTPHFERVFELLTAGLMAGLPLQIICEEDVRMGWLLPEGQPRVPMLFLVGQTQPLPEKVRRQIERFRTAGGQLFADADSADQPGAARLPVHTHQLRSLYNEGYAADTIYPLFAPVLERLAAELRAAVGPCRRYGVDSSNPWVAPNLFDGGAILYLLLSTDEGAPLPFAPGDFWELGELYRFSVRPQESVVSCPGARGVLYDVFRQRLVQETPGPLRVTARLDLVPAALYALAPEPLGPPRLETATDAAGRLHYRVGVRTASGLRLRARVPFRLVLRQGDTVCADLYRGSDVDGTLSGVLPLPGTGPDLRLEVAELLGGRAVAATVPCPAASPAQPAIVERLAVELLREDRLRELLRVARATGSLRLVQDEGNPALTAAQVDRLATACQTAGLRLDVPAVPPPPAPGVCLSVSRVVDGTPRGALAQECWRRGLLPHIVAASSPGAGRGLVTAVFAPRFRDEHALLVLGGDDTGLAHAVEALAAWLERGPTPATAAAATPPAPPRLRHTGRPADIRLATSLDSLVGPRLDSVLAAESARRVLVSARGYGHNLLLVAEDAQGQPRVVRSLRAGQASRVGPAWLSPDGTRFGATARATGEVRQGFLLAAATEERPWLFAAFGDLGRTRGRFAVTDDGGTVVAPGSYGVVCWRQEGEAWREAWALEYWKEYVRLDWPVSSESERNPQFQALIPAGGDTAVVLFAERSNQGWITPVNVARVRLSGHALRDGTERWRFDVPVPDKLLFPTLYPSADGRRLLLQVQVGSWGKESYRFYALDSAGTVHGTWSTGTGMAPTACALDSRGGRLALAYQGRLLEVRAADGTLTASLAWPDQPVGLAFAPGGERLYVADDAGTLTCLDATGTTLWTVTLGSVSALAAAQAGVYAAGWDGRLRALAPDGRLRWTLDCTDALAGDADLALVHQAGTAPAARTLRPRRAPTTAAEVPSGANLLAGGGATLTVGGTKGWMSNGALQVKAEDLTDGRTDDIGREWLHLDELFWDATAGRQVWAEIQFKAPTDVQALTVYEHPGHPENWPTEGVVQVWNAQQLTWDTAAFGLFLSGPVNTYALDLKGVTKLRYVPWGSYYRNFRTCEIEVR